MTEHFIDRLPVARMRPMERDFFVPDLFPLVMADALLDEETGRSFHLDRSRGQYREMIRGQGWTHWKPVDE